MNKKLNIINIILIGFALLFTGCATVSVNTYQDGKSLGKGGVRIGAGAEMSPLKNYGLFPPDVDPADPTKFKVFIEEADTDVDSTLYYWGVYNLLVQYGVTDNIDLGIMPFMGATFLNYGGKVLLKYGLMDQPGGLNAAVVPYFGLGTLGTTEDTSTVATGGPWELNTFAYNTTYWGLDIPVGFSDWGYVVFKIYQDKLTGKFVYYEEGEFNPELDVRTSFGVNVGVDTPGEYGRIEVGAMYEKTPQEDWYPRAYVGYNKFFTFGGKKNKK